MTGGSSLQHSFAQVLEAIDAQLVAGPHITGSDFECYVDVGPSSALWHLRVKGAWPLTKLPSVYLNDLTQAANMAHVNYKGDVCYSDHEGEGFSAAEADAPEVLANVVLRSQETLKTSAALRDQGNFNDLLDEFEGFWSSLPHCNTVPMESEPQSGIQLYARIRKDKGELTLYGIDTGSSSKSSTERIRVKVLTLDSPLLPPKPGTPWDKDWLDELLSLGEQQGLVLRTPGPHVLLCRQSRPSGGESLFGVSYMGVLQAGKVFAIKRQKPFGLSRSWRDYLLSRVGGKAIKRRVAVIGCGSLGGRVAEQLALSGLDELVLVDPELFSSDNIYRHVLGRDSVGAYKVEKLAEEIQKKRPGMTVISRHEDALRWLNTSGQREACFALVLATGNLALEREIVRLCCSEAWPQRIISGWVEPLGLGGHAIASRHGEAGCLECLHREFGEARPAPKTQFLTPGQNFSENLTGCGGAFTPYSALATIRTALMMTEMVLSDAHGYRCWTGPDDKVREKGMTTTYWYQQCVTQRLDGMGLDITEGHCPCCGT